MTQTRQDCGCKVGRVIDEFDLDGLDDDLAARRRGDGDEPASLRDLTDYFNQTVVRSALDRAGESPLEGEVENTYRLLTDDDVGSGTGIRVRKQLENAGVDVDAVEAGFVSHPTMGRHLEDCLGVERVEPTVDRVESARERIFKMESRAEAVIGNTLSGLVSAGQIAPGELSVTVDARVSCEACGVHGEVGQFIEGGGCACGVEE